LSGQYPPGWWIIPEVRRAHSSFLRQKLAEELRRNKQHYYRKAPDFFTADEIEQEGQWCEDTTLMAAANAFNLVVTVINGFSDAPAIVFYPVAWSEDNMRANESLNRRRVFFGHASNHYYSLRPVGGDGAGVASGSGSFAGAPAPEEVKGGGPDPDEVDESEDFPPPPGSRGEAKRRASVSSESASFRSTTKASTSSRDSGDKELDRLKRLCDELNGLGTDDSDAEEESYWQFLWWTGMVAPPIELYHGATWSGSCRYIGTVQDRMGALTANLKRAATEAMKATCPVEAGDGWKDLVLTGWLMPSIAH